MFDSEIVSYEFHSVKISFFSVSFTKRMIMLSIVIFLFANKNLPILIYLFPNLIIVLLLLLNFIAMYKFKNRFLMILIRSEFFVIASLILISNNELHKSSQ